MFQISSIYESDYDAIARQNMFKHIQARPKQRPRCNDMIAGLQHSHQRATDSGHARRCGKPIFGAFQRRHALFEHRNRWITIARIDEFVLARFQKPRLGGLGTVIDKSLG